MEGKVAIVTGSSRGIGRAIAFSLARRGVNVVINYLQNRQKAEEVVTYIKDNFSGRVISIQADVGNTEAVNRMIEETIKEFGRIDILVNNAGKNFMKSILDISEEQWDRVLDINLKGVFNCSKSVFKIMRKQLYGRIINITSISGMRGGFSGDVDYSAAKAGIRGFTMALARITAPYGITVNAVAPGYIRTDAAKDVFKEKLEILIKTIPMNRLGTPEEVAEMVAFLASEAASYITGEVINVNGGVYMG